MQWWTCDADTSLAIHPGAAPVHKSLKLRFSTVLHPSSVISGAKTDSFSDPQTVGNTRHTHTEVSEERFGEFALAHVESFLFLASVQNTQTNTRCVSVAGVNQKYISIASDNRP